MLSATASLGMILLWDVDGGLTQIDKYLYSSDDYIKVSGSMGTAYQTEVQTVTKKQTNNNDWVRRLQLDVVVWIRGCLLCKI